MPELTHDAEDGFHEIQLSGKQLVFLFMATTVVSVVIFLCGVLVGRGVRAERGGEDTVAAAPVPPSTVDAAPPSTEPPVPPKEDVLSYPDRLKGGPAAAEKLEKPATEAGPTQAPVQQAPVRQAAPPPQAPRADVPTSGRPGSWVIQVHALQNRDAAGTFVRTLTSKGYPAFLLNPAAGSPQIYRVQIGGYRDRGEAEQVVRRLEKEEQFKPALKQR